MTDFAEIILALAGAEVEFIIVGGCAAAVHGFCAGHIRRRCCLCPLA